MDWLQGQRNKLYNNTADKSDVLAQPMALQLHQVENLTNPPTLVNAAEGHFIKFTKFTQNRSFFFIFSPQIDGRHSINNLYNFILLIFSVKITYNNLNIPLKILLKADLLTTKPS